MSYLIALPLGIAPSIIWLLYFLRKDVHPEPKRMVIKIFCYGMLATIPVYLAQTGAFRLFSKIPILIGAPLFYLGGVALVEEGIKFLVVKNKVISNSEFDEPIDVMLYMIITALGFAALENIFVFSDSGALPCSTLYALQL